jgi:hypothetical protein
MSLFIQNEPLNIMHPKRVLVKEGELKRVKKAKTKKYYYYQFNDLLLIGTLTKGKYSLSRMIPFNEINLSQRQDSIHTIVFPLHFFLDPFTLIQHLPLSLTLLQKKSMLSNLLIVVKNMCWSLVFQQTKMFF